MPEAWRWGIEFIRALQPADAPALDILFIALTALGGGEFFLLLFPLILWSVNERAGARLLLLFLVSAQLNTALKHAFRHPRPSDLVPALQRVPTSGYGLPSGHAQGAVVIWGTLALWARSRGARLFFLALVFLVGASRVYLGVHFPTDVLAGWAVGALVVGAFVRGREPLEAWLAPRPGAQVVLALLVSGLLFGVAPEPDSAMVSGVFAGSSLGLVASSRAGGLMAGRGSTGQRLGRYCAGQAILVPAYGMVRWGVGESVLPAVAGYAVLGALMTFGIPRFLIRWGLAEADERRGRSL